jgi:hypothetical protein
MQLGYLKCANTGSESSFDCFVGLGELRRLESETEGLGSLKMGL